MEDDVEELKKLEVRGLVLLVELVLCIGMVAAFAFWFATRI